MKAKSCEVEVSDLDKSFGEIRAVRRLTFCVGRGEIFGLIGPDGAGKTTVLRMLAGILPPDSGAIRMAGCDVVRSPESVKPRISYVPQHFGLYHDLTVEENMRFVADLFEISRIVYDDKSAMLLAICGLSKFRNRLAGELSGGMKQKLAVICALIHAPRILLLDEPTNGVDPLSRRDLWAIFYSLPSLGVTVVISSASFNESQQCHRVAFLSRGRALIEDRPENLTTKFSPGVVSINCPDKRRVLDALQHISGITQVCLAGEGIRVFVDRDMVSIECIRVSLDRSGAAYGQIRSVPPTLEDVFVEAASKV